MVIASLGPLGHDADVVRQRAEQLFAEPPFAEGRPGPIGRFLRLVGDTLAGVLEAILGSAFSSGVLPWVLVTVGVGLLAWLVWRITRGLTADRTIAQVPADRPARTPADWHTDAEAAAARGDLREALRCRYGALVATLIAGGVLEEVPGRTVRELDSEIARSLPALAEPIAAAGARFDAAIYGHLEVSGDDLDVVTDAAQRAQERTASPVEA